MEAHELSIEQSFSSARAKFAEIVTHLGSDEVSAMTHSEVEKTLDTEGRELLRRLYQGYLHQRGPGEAAEPVVGADKVKRSHRRLRERGLMTVFGPVTVWRMAYGQRGVDSLHPLDGELNLPEESYSFGARRRAAEEAAKTSFDETVQTLETTTGATIAKRQVEELVQRAAADFDAFYEHEQTRAHQDRCDETGSVLVLSVDGKGVVMRHEDLRMATQRAAEKRKHKLSKRLSAGEKRNAKRMATVATVYTVGPFVRTAEDIVKEFAPVRDTATKRPRPEHKRVWASLEKSPGEVIEEAFKEASARDPNREKTWAVLVDGSESQLHLLETTARRYEVAPLVVLDIIHVLEYLWKASFALHHDDGPTKVEDWVTERLLEILRGRSSWVAAGMRRSATLRGMEDRQAVDKCADYLLKNARYLRYHEFLAAGLPIATGVIEGACRHLIKDRMDLTGARWSLSGAEAVLRLRSIRSSGDFDNYWSFHESKEFERNHAAFYSDRTLPISRRSRGHLKLVK